MKITLYGLLSLFLLGTTALCQPLIVHEWGTFTTVHGSSGGTLSGLYFEEHALPPFVYHHPGFAPDPMIVGNGYRPCKDVTVKMETPVLYFYSPIEQEVKVHVDFPHGRVTQWYPERSGGETPPLGDTVDFSYEQTGSIDWEATVLAPSSTEPLSQQATGFPKWIAPRSTDANLVKAHTGEVEKYLFYRGLANFELPLEAKFINDTSLLLRNTSGLDIPFVFIYHQSGYSVGIWATEPLPAGAEKIFTRPKQYTHEDFAGAEHVKLRDALEREGLTRKEADAMLKTWDEGYFITTGFKVFWIVPRELTDQILPLQITPTPDSIERVLVGKTEVLTPAFEKGLLTDFKNGRIENWKNDRYYLAYKQRALELFAIDEQERLEEEARLAAEEAKKLKVHEWGTFTTLHGSDGGSLSGLYYEEERLPDFVYHLPGFSPDPYIFTNGYKPCKNVTVKMETPVLYFYSSIEHQVNVHVDFPIGSISQWYPDRSDGEMAQGVDTIDFSLPRTGFIKWDATVLAPSTSKALTHPYVSKKWDDPRQTDANLVTAYGDVEKYLFYRGVANFPLPVIVQFSKKDLLVHNTSTYDIPFIYIYDHQTSSAGVKIWGTGPLAANQAKVFTQPEQIIHYDQNGEEYLKFRSALQTAGLTYKEAEAMLNTWSDGYFQTPGFKIFWIVPRSLTDQILPLTITPEPDSVNRVLVGKTEILTPEFEKQLLADYTSGVFENWKDHHYYLAYKQRMEQLVPAGVAGHNEFVDNNVFPNPVGNTLFIRSTGREEAIDFTLRNILGEVVDHSILTVTAGVAQVNVSHLPTGIYFLHAIENGQIKAMKIIKD